MSRLFRSVLRLSSLRSQLLLWISLPVLVVLLTFALAGVQGHGQAMHELVQTRADSLAQAAAVLISTRIDQEQDRLVRFSVDPFLHQAPLERGAVAEALQTLTDEFPAGVAFFSDGAVEAATVSVPWLNRNQVGALVDSVTADHPGVVAIPNENGADWLLVHAVLVPTPGSARRVLVGSVPLSALGLPALFRSLVNDDPSQFVLIAAQGEPLLTVGAVDSQVEDQVVLARSAVPRTDLAVLLRQPWTEWIPPVLRFGNVLLLVLLAAAVLSVLSAYFGLQQIVYPLQRLNRAVGALGKGRFDAVERPVGGVQEIEDLRLALAAMARQIRQYQGELQSYIGAMTQGQEEERKRLARELHDETVQALIALNQQVEMAERRLVQDPERAAVRLRELRPLIASTIASVRRQIQNLRPLFLEDLGFVPALEMLVQQTAAQHGLVGDFQVSGGPQRPLPPAVEISGYRIVQEALQNIANHAQASWVHVELIFDSAGIRLRIEDDGVGFEAPDHPHQMARAGHYGLLGMQERARLHGGALQIESKPGEGTTVVARLSVLGDVPTAAQTN